MLVIPLITLFLPINISVLLKCKKGCARIHMSESMNSRLSIEPTSSNQLSTNDTENVNNYSFL